MSILVWYIGVFVGLIFGLFIANVEIPPSPENAGRVIYVDDNGVNYVYEIQVVNNLEIE